jgi:hypothetical protein
LLRSFLPVRVSAFLKNICSQVNTDLYFYKGKDIDNNMKRSFVRSERFKRLEMLLLSHSSVSVPYKGVGMKHIPDFAADELCYVQGKAQHC